jgi:hypothetical protein
MVQTTHFSKKIKNENFKKKKNRKKFVDGKKVFIFA